MKIGIDIRMIGRKRTGDETVFFNLVKNLALIDNANEYTLFLDMRTQDEVAAIKQSLSIEGKSNFTIVVLPAKNKFDWNLCVLPKYLRQHPVDVYHTQYIVPFFVPKNIRIVTHVHDISFRIYPRYIHWKDRLFLGLLIPRSLRRADRIIAVSEFTKREIIEHYGVDAKKIDVVLNALSGDFSRFEDVSSERVVMVREKYGLPETFILYVGTLQPRKNVPALIRAFARIQDRISDTRLVIVGNRQGYHYDTAIDAAIDECGVQNEVIFPGFVDQEDLPIIMRMARVFAFPSLYEGFGLPVLEAMSQHVPTVASDIAPLREVGGEAAMYANTDDVAGFAEILYTVSTESDVRKRLVEAGIRQGEMFSWQESAKHLLEIYQSLS